MAKMWKVTLLVLCLGASVLCQEGESNDVDQTSNDIINPDEFSENDQYHFVAKPQEATELPGGFLTGEKTLRLSESPYLLRQDLEIERDAKLVVEAGVTVQVAPMVGITVRGVIKAIGTPEKIITFTSQPNSGYSDSDHPEPHEIGARLVDGPSPKEGRLQLYHHGKWRSVCSNSKNWTISDYETVCRQLGYKGGRFWNWLERTYNYDPRILYEDPGCSGSEAHLDQCRNWRARQLGSGVCDYHADIGVQCQAALQGMSSHWGGLQFEYAQDNSVLFQDNTLYEAKSLSKLKHVSILRAGAGRNREVSAGIGVLGVPPQLRHVLVDHSAYTGINVTRHDAAFTFHDVTVKRSKGVGMFFNSSYGLVQLENCKISENGDDGVRYVGHDLRAEERKDRSQLKDFCTLPRTSNQIYPIHLTVDQSQFAGSTKECSQLFTTNPGYTLSLSFVFFMVRRNESAKIEVFDGASDNDRLIGTWLIRNSTRPQALNSHREKLFVRFTAEPRSEVNAYLKVTASAFKVYDLNVTGSVVADNAGRGVAVDNLRSSVHIHQSDLNNNNHVAGLHVTSGAGDVNVTDSHISFNQGSGINITYHGGNRNISRSFISSNHGYGVSVWLNETLPDRQEFLAFNQTTVLQYSEITRNVETGFYHGNYSRDQWVNVTGNFFNASSDAVEVLSSWFNEGSGRLRLQIGHNDFKYSRKISVVLAPALNMDAHIEYNHFEYGDHGQILVRNIISDTVFRVFRELFRTKPVKILVRDNYFTSNRGVYVASLGLSPYSDTRSQHILFYRNFVQNNKITEPFTAVEDLGEGMSGEGRLSPRSRVAAPIVISSNNVDVYRNILSNPDSKYEVGSQLSDQSQILNVTYNWLGTNLEERIYQRVFHRKDRYNLAKIEYLPFLLHNSNPMATQIFQHSLYVPRFFTDGDYRVGGEVDGQEVLPPGVYTVDRDVSVRPGGKLILKAGVTLNFLPSVGMMVAGKLEARGRNPNDILFTLKREPIMTNESEALLMDEMQVDMETESIDIPTTVRDTTASTPVKLVGGKTEHEGRLQVFIDGRWGTVCDYNWNIINAALVCHQLGLALNPKDWRLERSEVPSAGLEEDVILSNVRCTDHDTDLTRCRAEYSSRNEFENSCSHEADVGVRCYEGAWAGLRFGVLAEQADLQYVTIEKAGLFDYITNEFKPAMQFDFAKHNLNNVRVVENLHDGLGVVYSDIYSGSVNNIRNCEFSKNRGNGVSLKQLGLNIRQSIIRENMASGIHHDPVLSALEQRELAGWFQMSPDFKSIDSEYYPYVLPEFAGSVIDLDQWKQKYILTERTSDDVEVTISIRCQPGYVIGMQLLSPIENRSSEEIIIYDSQTGNAKSDIWYVKRDLSVFPVSSSSYAIVLKYRSGQNALGGVVLVLNAIQAPVQNIYNRIVRGPVPTLSVQSTKIQNNYRGLTALYYNRYLGDEAEHYLRKANESIKLVNVDMIHNLAEAVYINSPYWDVHESNISEITIHINGSRIQDNGRGVRQFSKDLRASNNLFHYVIQDTSFERNSRGGLELSLPFVWQYNENFTHSVYLGNDTWAQNRRFGVAIEGHYAGVNITGNRFIENDCAHGLVSFKGMEKKLRIDYNQFTRNNGKHMVEFKVDSQSEIVGQVFALFAYNELEENYYSEKQMLRNDIRAALRAYHQKLRHPTCVIGFSGVQKVTIYRNLFRGNGQEYDLVAGIRSARLNNELLATENWWGSTDPAHIQTRIFDFDDWNNHAEVKWRPYLLENSLYGSQSASVEEPRYIDLSRLGGKISEDLVIENRGEPYIVTSDITIMPKTTVMIQGGVEMRFAPNVGILVLGTLIARGISGGEILMRPTEEPNISVSRKERGIEDMHDGIRLCRDGNCTSMAQGFLEYFNHTTLQWVPICDRRFTERNAHVVCRELGFDPLDTFYGHDRRIEFHLNSLTRIWSWVEPLECEGDESKLYECPERLNGQVYGRRHECKWDDTFVFVACNGEADTKSYWGGIRFANPDFEQNLYEHRIHDTHTHDTIKKPESTLEHVRIVRAGILHGEKSAAVQSINKNPTIVSVNIVDSAHHGVNLVSPADSIHLRHLNVQGSLGQGINAISLTGEGRESDESSFSPLKDLDLPYSLFSLVDICDTTKVITIEERVLLYYKYDNNPVTCVKIFNSAFRVKPLGFRLLQSNLFNHSKEYGRRDNIQLFDGDIYNISSIKVGQVEADGENERRLFKTHEPILSVRLIASGAPARYGFIAEVVTLPISGILFNRDAQHNISNSEFSHNVGGAIEYISVGEVSPILTLEKNRFQNNCRQLYGNFSTCDASIHLDVQNMQSLFFRNNLIQQNQGGLSVRADSRGSATSLRGYIHHNLFVQNANRPTLAVEGRQSSPYQEVTVYKNYVTQNRAAYRDVISLRQVVSNFTYNYIHSNRGGRIMEISGFDKVRLPIYQTTTHNGFYDNIATDWRGRATIVAGTAGQHYVDNIFYNPDNDYEIITVNKSIFEFQYWNSTIDLWKTKIDATHNYWSYNETLAVGSRIRDRIDDPQLLEVQFLPLQMNNKTILEGQKCPPGWSLVYDTCYMYVGAPMTFNEAREFCRSDNASLPFIRGDTTHLWLYLQRQMAHLRFTERVWVQDLDFIGKCTSFIYQSVEFADCETRSPFLCEIDPKVTLSPIFWQADIVFISVTTMFFVALFLLALLCCLWYAKTKRRRLQRFERRNSIRQSLRSLNSLDPNSSLRRRNMNTSRSNDTLKSNATDYKKMVTNGSLESIEKSVLSSEVSFDPYDPSNFTGETEEFSGTANGYPPKPETQPRTKVYGLPEYNGGSQGFELAYRNEGFKDNSVYSGDRNVSVGTNLNDDSTPIIHHTDAEDNSDYYGNSSTLPIRDQSLSFLTELKNRLPEYESLPRPTQSSFLPPPPTPPQAAVSAKVSAKPSPPHKYAVPEFRRPAPMEPPPDVKRPDSYYKATRGIRDSASVHRPRTLYEAEEKPASQPKTNPYARSKSEALLETNFDDNGGAPSTPVALGPDSRSYSQPLETAM